MNTPALKPYQTTLMALLFLLVSSCHAQEGNETPMETVDIFVDSGARQCQYTGHPLQHTEQKLLQLGIEVLASHCGQLTGVMFPAVCGGRTEKINIHTIDANDLPKAENAGYKAIASLAQGADPGYQVVKCDKRGINLSRDI